MDYEQRIKAMRAIRYALLCCFAFMVTEIIGGTWSHSLAILTDAAHLFTDVGALSLALFSLHVTTRKASMHFSFGFHRAEVVGSLGSVLTIWALVAVIIVEAVGRIKHMWGCSQVQWPLVSDTYAHPHLSAKKQAFLLQGLGSNGVFGQPRTLHIEDLECAAVQAPMMLLLGSLGLLVNIAVALILSWGGHDPEGSEHPAVPADHSHFHSHGTQGEHSHQAHDQEDVAPLVRATTAAPAASEEEQQPVTSKGLALKGAFLHALGDCIQSIGVVASAGFIWYMNIQKYGASSHPLSVYNLADPVSSLIFCIVTLWTTTSMLKQLFNILMESTPDHIDVSKLRKQLEAIPDVVSCHDLHVWSLSSNKPSLSAHLISDNHVEVLLLARRVCEDFGIYHSTIQVDPLAHGSAMCCDDIH